MKRLSVILVLIALVAWSCHRSQNSSKTSDTDTLEVAKAKENNAKNQFNYYGRYLGIIPCADCEGIETKIHLQKDNTYIKETKYLGKGDNEVYKVEGNFSWDTSGNTIILEGITDSPNKYYVTRGAITQLDMDGNVITGNLSEKYRLRKTL